MNIEMEKADVITLVKCIQKMNKLDSLCDGTMFDYMSIDLLGLFPIGMKMLDMDTTELKPSVIWGAWIKFVDDYPPDDVADALIRSEFLGITPEMTIEEIKDCVKIEGVDLHDTETADS